MLGFNDAIPLLGVLLTAIGAIFAYRAAERQRERAVDRAVTAAPAGIIATITDKDAGLQMGTAMAELADVLRKGVAVIREEREDPSHKRQVDRLIDELVAHRREVARVAEAIEKLGHR